MPSGRHSFSGDRDRIASRDIRRRRLPFVRAGFLAYVLSGFSRTTWHNQVRSRALRFPYDLTMTFEHTHHVTEAEYVTLFGLSQPGTTAHRVIGLSELVNRHAVKFGSAEANCASDAYKGPACSVRLSTGLFRFLKSPRREGRDAVAMVVASLLGPDKAGDYVLLQMIVSVSRCLCGPVIGVCRSRPGD